MSNNFKVLDSKLVSLLSFILVMFTIAYAIIPVLVNTFFCHPYIVQFFSVYTAIHIQICVIAVIHVHGFYVYERHVDAGISIMQKDMLSVRKIAVLGIKFLATITECLSTHEPQAKRFLMIHRIYML